jgi:hypothetical protein
MKWLRFSTPLGTMVLSLWLATRAYEREDFTLWFLAGFAALVSAFNLGWLVAVNNMSED